MATKIIIILFIFCMSLYGQYTNIDYENNTYIWESRNEYIEYLKFVITNNHDMIQSLEREKTAWTNKNFWNKKTSNEKDKYIEALENSQSGFIEKIINNLYFITIGWMIGKNTK